jgi:hypothetical protein
VRKSRKFEGKYSSKFFRDLGVFIDQPKSKQPISHFSLI